MYKDYRYINAGENEIYRYGKKAQEKANKYLVSENGYYSIPVDGGKYWTLGTSDGKYGEFMKYGDTIFSVNKSGYAYAKADGNKAEKFVKMVEALIEEMKSLNNARLEAKDAEEDDDE